MPRYGTPGAVTPVALATPYDAPITITLTGYAAQELRRVSRSEGAGTEQGLATLATACVMRGLPYVESDLAGTRSTKTTTRRARDTDDDLEDSP